MKLKLPPPPVHPKYPEESEAEARHWFNSHRAYALQAIREFVEGQRYEGWLLVNKESGDRRVQKTCVVADADIPLVNRYPLIIKPELDDADR